MFPNHDRLVKTVSGGIDLLGQTLALTDAQLLFYTTRVRQCSLYIVTAFMEAGGLLT